MMDIRDKATLITTEIEKHGTPGEAIYQLRAQLAASREEALEERASYEARIANLTAKLAAKESAEQEPVKLPSELTVLNRPYGYPQETEETIQTQEQYASGWNAAISEVKKLGALYTTPPTTSAAVAAALRKAAEVCDTQAIEDLPADDSALREVCLKVADEVAMAFIRYSPKRNNIETIVDEVLGPKP